MDPFQLRVLMGDVPLFLGSSTSSSVCWRCAMCLSGGQSYQLELRIDSSSTDYIADLRAFVARHCWFVVCDRA